MVNLLKTIKEPIQDYCLNSYQSHMKNTQALIYRLQINIVSKYGKMILIISVLRIRFRSETYTGLLSELVPVTYEKYPGFDLQITDQYRFKIWKDDFDNLCSKDSLPSFQLIRLPSDHTSGTRKGTHTVSAMVADNDYALGQIVETISKSKYWNNSMIFVVEDDAQNGSDHVDAHRSVMLTIGPYVKRGFVDHTMYTSSSVLKTMEQIPS